MSLAGPAVAPTRLRTLVLAVCVGLLSSAAPAQPRPGTARIGYLTSGGCPSRATAQPGRPLSGFVKALEERGWILGQNFSIDCRTVNEGGDERLAQFATELVHLEPALIFAVSSGAVRAARSATATIPVVALDFETDPVARGLAASLGRPGGHVTGIFLDADELNGKRLEMLKATVPRLSRVAALWDVTMDPIPLKTTETLARSIGVQLQVLSVKTVGDVAGALDTAARSRAGAVMVMQSPFMDLHREQIANVIRRHRLPAIGIFGSFVEAGGLLSYGPDLTHLFSQSTSYIDRILRGANPGDLPIERPTRFHTAVNLKTAAILGLTIPPSVLARADQVLR